MDAVGVLAASLLATYSTHIGQILLGFDSWEVKLGSDLDLQVPFGLSGCQRQDCSPF